MKLNQFYQRISILKVLSVAEKVSVNTEFRCYFHMETRFFLQQENGTFRFAERLKAETQVMKLWHKILHW